MIKKGSGKQNMNLSQVSSTWEVQKRKKIETNTTCALFFSIQRVSEKKACILLRWEGWIQFLVLEIQGWVWLFFMSFEESFEKHCLVCNFSFQIISPLDLNLFDL